MTEAVTRAEFDALEARLTAIIEATGCTTPEGLDADKRLRKFIAVWDSESERRQRDEMAEMLAWFRAEKVARQTARDNAQARREARRDIQIGIAALVGVTVLAQALGGWVVQALRAITGDAP